MGHKMLEIMGNVNVEADRQLEVEVEEMGIVPSWGTERQGLGTGITMVAIMKSETVTRIELRGGSKLRLSLLKICEWKRREIDKRKA